MEIKGFEVEQPVDVCDQDGLDENDARSHFNGKRRDEIDYSDAFLTEDLAWMHHQAFKYYLPGFLLESIQDSYGDIASATLSVIASHVSGPKANRIRFTHDEAQSLDRWMDLILSKFRDDDSWGFYKRIAKYRSRISSG